VELSIRIFKLTALASSALAAIAGYAAFAQAKAPIH
jgi:hypothetical protein